MPEDQDSVFNESDISGFQHEKITELRSQLAEALQKYPAYDTDFSMLRWLMGWDYDIDVIVPKVEKTIDVLVNLGLNNQYFETTEEINSYIRNLHTAADYFPGGIMGQDLDGNMIYMQTLAKTHPRTLVKAGSVSALFHVLISETELAMKIIRSLERETKQKLGVKMILDLDGFSMDLLYTPTLKIYLSLLSALQEHFPDFARKIYVVNSPMMIHSVYSMISPVLAKQTREKISFLGSDWKEILRTELGKSNIYPHWGGTKKHSNPQGDLRLGGKVPEKLHYSPENNPSDQKDLFKKLSVGARSKEIVTISAKEGDIIRWIWRVSSGDIDFSAELNGNEVWPKFRLPTEFVPEIGQMVCKETGSYSFIFDNSHGKLFGKDIKYHPCGKLVQIEYALHSVKHGQPSVGLTAKDGVVLATENVTPALSVHEPKAEKISEHIGCVYSGMGPDSRRLVNRARQIAMEHKMMNGKEIPTIQLVTQVAAVMQESGGVRPFGVSLLIAGWDKIGKPLLFQCDPSLKAAALGKNDVNAKTFLGKGMLSLLFVLQLSPRFTETLELNDGIRTGLRALRESFDVGMTKDNVEVAVCVSNGFRILTKQQVKDHLGSL